MADIVINVHQLPEIQPDDQAAALATSDERFLQARIALLNLEAALDGYDDLLGIVQQVREVVMEQRNDLVDATILLGAFSEGMRTLKEQRDQAVRQQTGLLEAIGHWETTDNEIIAEMREDIRQEVEERIAEDDEWAWADSDDDTAAINVADTLSRWSGADYEECSELAEALLGGDTLPEQAQDILQAILHNLSNEE